MTLAEDNQRLRLHMKRVIHEREIARAALSEIADGVVEPEETASDALEAMLRLPHVSIPSEASA